MTRWQPQENILQLVAKNRSERHYRNEEFSWRGWHRESSVRLLSQVAVHGSHQGRHRARSRATHPPPATGRRSVMLDPDAHMPRINRGMVYLGACLIAGRSEERRVGIESL